MKIMIHVQLITKEFRGDHEADVRQVLDCPGDMRLADVIQHLMRDGKPQVSDHIEIRIGEQKS